MRKKSVAAVLLCFLVIAASVISLVFLSKLQNERMNGKIYLTPKAERKKETKRSMLQKIILFQKGMKAGNVRVREDSNPFIWNRREKELEELYSMELFPFPQEDFTIGRQERYEVQTNAGKDSVVMWKIGLIGKKKNKDGREPYACFWMEDESGKVIGVEMSEISLEEKWRNHEKEIVEKWGKQCAGENIDVTKNGGGYYLFSEGEVLAEYVTNISENTFIIRPSF